MRVFWHIFAVLTLCGCAARSPELEDLSACYGYGCEWYGRANAVVSYARVIGGAGSRSILQDVELILDDGRIFAVYGYTGSREFKIGDRTIVDYRYRKVKKIEYVGSIYGDWTHYYVD
jgi:hypothetical protein